MAAFHHGELLHASASNHGALVSPCTTLPRMFVRWWRKQIHAGAGRTDRCGHFQHVPSPTDNLTEHAIAWQRNIQAAHAIYAGVTARWHSAIGRVLLGVSTCNPRPRSTWP